GEFVIVLGAVIHPHAVRRQGAWYAAGMNEAGTIGDDADNEKDKASAAIPTMSSLGGAFGAAIAGVIANGAGLVHPGGIPGALSAAHWLYLLMALPGVLAVA
ncbi:hypothetical protein ACCT11_35600, partial [Rhizobium johnstonii]